MGKSYEITAFTHSQTTNKLLNEAVTLPVKSGLRKEPISFHD